MDKELQSKLVEILSSIQAATGKASDFAMGQLPDIAQSYVMYGRSYLTLTVVASLLVCIAIAVVAMKANGKVDKWNKGLPLLIGGLLSMVPMLALFGAMPSMLMVWVAPKVWLLKELASFVK